MMDPFRTLDVTSLLAMLREFPASVKKTGEAAFRAGRAHELKVVTPGRRFEVQVEGNPPGTVDLHFSPKNRQWEGYCSCPDEFDCLHVYAAGKALLAEHSQAQVQGLSSHEVQAGRPPEGTVDHSFQEKVVAALGRSLNPKETAYLRELQRLFKVCQASGAVPTFDLRRLGLPLADIMAFELVVAPFPIRDEHEFWYGLARLARARKVVIPDFLKPVSEHPAMEARLRRAEEAALAREWRNRFSNIIAQEAALPESTGIREHEFTVQLDAEVARLLWKPEAAQSSFQHMKRADMESLVDSWSLGLFRLASESELLWTEFARHFHYTQELELRLMNPADEGVINRLLRVPSLKDRFVNGAGEILARVDDPLVWHLTPPGPGGASYALHLACASGEPAPPIFRVFPGRPALHLTSGSLYAGPWIDERLLSARSPNLIPASAIESSEGIALLRKLGVPIPDSIQSLVRTSLMEVLIRCRIRLPYPGSPHELCCFDILAQTPDKSVMRVFDGAQWLGAREHDDEEAFAGEPGPRHILSLDTVLMDRVPRIVAPLGLAFDARVGSLAIRMRKDFPVLFADWLATVPPGVTVELDGELKSLSGSPVAGRVKLEVEGVDQDWFDLRVVLDVSDTELSPEEIRLLLAAKGSFVRLEGKGWRRLQYDISGEEDDDLARLGLSSMEFSDEPQRLHALQLSDRAARRFMPAEQVEQIQRRVSELRARVTPDVPASLDAQLRPYQTEGFHFLAYLAENRFGGILADDMGLGKTLQTLAWLIWLRDRAAAAAPGSAEGPAATALVVCPKSVMDNWAREAIRFAPTLKVRVWRAAELQQLPAEPASADIHVINYNQLRLLGEALQSVRWMAVILDEGQFVKNPNSQTAQIARGLRAENRLVLTGTPIENRLLDLWSLMSFAMPGMLGSRAQFGKLYDGTKDPRARKRLSARVRPFLLRRTKRQVAGDLPERIEEDIICEMEGEQKTLYTAELKRAQQILLRVKTQKQLAKETFHVLTSLLRLRQICCSPRLLDPSSPSAGAKLEALLEQLEPLMQEGHKVLVFSQFVEMLELLRGAVVQNQWECFFLSGSTENRGELVEKFQEKEGAAVFLISLKAGGFGLNLTAASYVVLFDPWWNPAVENQAIDRTHRIGQRNTVNAYRLLIKGSVEEKIRKLQREKANLADDVLGEEKFSQSLTLDDLQYLFAD